MNKKPTLAIIGCGWLGRHIVPTLSQAFTLLATTAHPLTAKQLNIPAWVYDWTKDTLPSALLNASHYLIAIPPTAGGYAHYAENTMRLVSTIGADKPIVFVSSSGIYPAAPGTYHEDSVVSTDSALYQAEQALIQIAANATILRCSGLFGDGRLNGQQYYGKTNNMPNKRLNLIHYQDIAHATKAVLIQHKMGRIYNLSHPEHPPRHSYYQAQARLRGQSEPLFTNPHIEPERIIDGSKIEGELDFYYQCPPTLTI